MGGARGSASTAGGSPQTDLSGFFAGLYASWHRNDMTIDVSLSAGNIAVDQTRLVANNMVAGGVETAQAAFDAGFFSPDLTLTRLVAAGERHLEVSVSLSYAGFVVEGFSETGAADGLSIADRTIHVAQARAQLTLPNERQRQGGAIIRSEIYVGVEGGLQFGDPTITGDLLGQALAFDPGNGANADVFGGIGVEQFSQGGASVFAAIEVSNRLGGGLSVAGQAGFRFRF